MQVRSCCVEHGPIRTSATHNQTEVTNLAYKTIPQTIESKQSFSNLMVVPGYDRECVNGRNYPAGSFRRQAWWQSLDAPDGQPHGTAKHGLANEQKEVLVVEDESYLRDLIADVLESDGHRARTAANGLDALRILEEHKPQLILLDLMMPIMDGLEFMTQIRKHEEWLDIPVIIITAIYDIRDTAKETGARAIITKPFDIDQLSELVNLYAN